MPSRSRTSAALLLLAALAACSTSTPPERSDSSAPGTPAAVTAMRLSNADERLVPGLEALDLRDAVAAPTVAERPPGRALLVATVSPFATDGDGHPLGVGQPAVLTAAGEWRRLPPEDHDAGEGWGVETPYALSGDGRIMAVGEEGTARVVVVDLADGSWREVGLPTEQGVAFELDDRGTALVFADRGVGLDRGWRRLDLATGAVSDVAVPWWERARFRDGQGESAGLLVDGARLDGTTSEREWLGAVGGEPDQVVAFEGDTGRVFVWRPREADLDLVARVVDRGTTLEAAGDVLADLRSR